MIDGEIVVLNPIGRNYNCPNTKCVASTNGWNFTKQEVTLVEIETPTECSACKTRLDGISKVRLSNGRISAFPRDWLEPKVEVPPIPKNWNTVEAVVFRGGHLVRYAQALPKVMS